MTTLLTQFLGRRATAAAVAVLAAALGGGARAEEETGFHALANAKDWTAYAAEPSTAWPSSWKLEGEEIHCAGGGVGDLKTTKHYGDFDLRFQWKISAGGNSGVMYRVSQETDPAYFTGPEYQILDDAAHAEDSTPATSSASLYDLYAPQDPQRKPVGEWNEGRIVLRGQRVEHYLNGKLVVEAELGSEDWNKRVAPSKFAAWKKFGKNAKGHIVLQDHGNEVWFRNVRVKEL